MAERDSAAVRLQRVAGAGGRAGVFPALYHEMARTIERDAENQVGEPRFRLRLVQ